MLSHKYPNPIMAGLFTDNFPDSHSDEDLDTLSAQYPYYDRYYIASGSIPKRRAKFEKLYAKYAPYTDSHFLQEAKKNFHQRTWEMYIACVLLENGLSITSKDEGPDIKMVLASHTIWIECVAPNKGTGNDRVPDLVDGLQDVPEEKMLLRITNALKDKFETYQEYLDKNIVGQNDIFIIAVNRSQLEHFDSIKPLILKCLFGLGYLTLPTRLGDRKPGNTYYSRRGDLKKQGGSLVSMRFFEDRQHEGISATIYSSQDILNHPDELGDDCMIVHNPMAKNPLSESIFSFLRQWKVRENNIIKI
jgi:hypothetical protein